MQIIYKEIEENDIEDIYEISKLSFITPWSLESIKNEFKNKFSKYIVAKNLNTNKIIGFIGIWIICGEGSITNIAVHPDFRGNKISSKLLSNLIEMCALENCFDITLEVRESNIVAQNLYLKHGFVKDCIRKKYYSDTNEDAIIMWKR